MQITKPGRGDEERERRRKGNGAGLEAQNINQKPTLEGRAENPKGRG